MWEPHFDSSQKATGSWRGGIGLFHCWPSFTLKSNLCFYEMSNASLSRNSIKLDRFVCRECHILNWQEKFLLSLLTPQVRNFFTHFSSFMHSENLSVVQHSCLHLHFDALSKVFWTCDMKIFLYPFLILSLDLIIYVSFIIIFALLLLYNCFSSLFPSSLEAKIVSFIVVISSPSIWHNELIWGILDKVSRCLMNVLFYFTFPGKCTVEVSRMVSGEIVQ